MAKIFVKLAYVFCHIVSEHKIKQKLEKFIFLLIPIYIFFYDIFYGHGPSRFGQFGPRFVWTISEIFNQRLISVISILSTTVNADRHVHKTMKYEAEQKYKIGNI